MNDIDKLVNEIVDIVAEEATLIYSMESLRILRSEIKKLLNERLEISTQSKKVEISGNFTKGSSVAFDGKGGVEISGVDNVTVSGPGAPTLEGGPITFDDSFSPSDYDE
jgi:hypothetical protein